MKKLLAVLLALLMVSTAFSTAALATVRSNATTLRSGTWYRLPSEQPKYATCNYKLILHSDSFVTVDWKNNKGIDAHIWIYADPQDMYDWHNVAAPIDDNQRPSGTRKYAMKKGTYYIQMFDKNAMARFTVEKAVYKKNYCPAKAVLLGPNRTVKIAQTIDYYYDRWYKIKLNRKKTVTITGKDYQGNDWVGYELYDSRFNWVPRIETDLAHYVTKEPIERGTYYIWVKAPRSGYTAVGYYQSLKWH